ncbi:probable ABC drug resistance transporter, permease component [[Actinomadura] parvosata subsp. kistnae]|uniref:Transport permease protein n=1 Tax=[Actinomadura] parvosata subsp. kistnae TaxID=1909395 RepID=A0A1U9ZXM5_9ACTN|nr:ABC transporter permease [Nonomuraea sp. ATCC 55076]AQZ62706.1 ABC transporter permease [Nonomuraea sp. ATCC 55076]SPL89016.1 probable ABC drug resistance transporter, permease component [Actinomadura parvosata subsp. kistnae]
MRAITDSVTMTRRQIRHIWRYPTLVLTFAAVPVVFLLLFVYVFGGAMGAGLGAGRAAYVGFLVPGIMVTTIVGAAQGTAISVATDMTEGIIARFKTMAIARVSVLTGHVLGALAQTFLAVAVVMVVALLIGFRPAASVAGWAGVVGVLAMFTFAITWLSVALAMVSRNVATASNLPMPLMVLPFLGSGFVPAESMPGPLRWFAEHQPVTPVIETLRALLAGRPAGPELVEAAVWSAGIALAGYLWARRLYNR